MGLGLRIRYTVDLCLGAYGGRKGGAVSYERGTPVGAVGFDLERRRGGEVGVPRESAEPSGAQHPPP